MRKKQTQKSKKLPISQDEANKLQKEYQRELDTNPQLSLDVDPENKYNMSELQKDFIRYYVDYKSVGTAAELCAIDMDKAKEFYVAYSTQQEIRRINKALYHRQFNERLVSLDEIGGYLTSLLTDNVPIADQLKSKEKLQVAQMLIDLNEKKINAIADPSTIMNQSIDLEIKNLSIKTIQQLLNAQKNPIDVEFNENISMEEKAYLETLPAEELLKLLDETNKGENHDQ